MTVGAAVTMLNDAYTLWLGIPPGPRPPNHYDLLAVPAFCDDQNEIEGAARDRLAELDRYSIHPDRLKRDDCHRLMTEVAKARLVLGDPARKARYDQEIFASLSGDGPAAVGAGGYENGSEPINDDAAAESYLLKIAEAANAAEHARNRRRNGRRVSRSGAKRLRRWLLTGAIVGAIAALPLILPLSTWGTRLGENRVRSDVMSQAIRLKDEAQTLADEGRLREAHEKYLDLAALASLHSGDSPAMRELAEIGRRNGARIYQGLRARRLPPPAEEPAVDVTKDMTPVGCVQSGGIDGVVLTGGEYGKLRTLSILSPPTHIEVIAKTDSPSLRLYWGDAMFILNWELDADALPFGAWSPWQDITMLRASGRIPINKWVRFDMIVTDSKMWLLVDGTPRAVGYGRFTGKAAAFGIGPSHGSRVTVRSVKVQRETRTPEMIEAPFSQAMAGSK